MGCFGWLAGSPLMKAEWRSVPMECGEQCVMITGITMMQQLCADSWGFLDQVLIFAMSKYFLLSINSTVHCLVTSVLYGYQHKFGRGTGPVFLYGTRCTGAESSLLRCRHSGIDPNWCSHSKDAAVVCSCMWDHIYVD